MDFELLQTLIVPLLEGAVFSILFTIAFCLVGGTLALMLALLESNGGKNTRRTINVLSDVVRGFPLLVLLYFTYFGLPSLQLVRESWLWTVFSSPFFCALLAFSINHAFFVAQILIGALRNLPAGLKEAAKALGLHPYAAFLKIELPLASRLALPAYRNEVVMAFKASSLVTVVTLTDILSVAKTSVEMYYDPITPFIGAAVLYWLIVQIIQISFDLLDQKMVLRGGH